MQLLFQDHSYRVVYAPEARKRHADWSFLRRIKESTTQLERWECLTCAREFSHFLRSLAISMASSVGRIACISFSLYVCLLRTTFLETSHHAGDKGSCAHVQAWPGDAPAMSDEAFEKQIRNFMDERTGERRLTCISRTHIPEDLAHGTRADDWASA